MSRTFRSRTAIAALALATLAACGGGGGGGDTVSPNPPPATGDACSVQNQRVWLSQYFAQSYYWNALTPAVNPYEERTVAQYFEASLYKGTDARFPADRWSYMADSAGYNQFFEEGKSTGYGVNVRGLEVVGHPEQPLYVRYVDPGSDAEAKGIRRGDRIHSINGRAASDMIAKDDFSALSAPAAGQSITLDLESTSGVRRSVTVVSKTYALQPVTHTTILSTPAGRTVGYLMVKDFVDQVDAPLASAMASFKASGIQDLVIDLRYNGGGLVSTSAKLASYVSGALTSGKVYAQLLFNEREAAANNYAYRFTPPTGALALSRVFVLAGPRTCSASELVVNGLKPYVNVVVLGDTTCGKPFGFVPGEKCGMTYSIVNFESVNANGEGRYVNGIAPTCTVTDDVLHVLGSPDEGLLKSALNYADTGRCPITAFASGRETGSAALPAVTTPRSVVERGVHDGGRQGMIGR